MKAAILIPTVAGRAVIEPAIGALGHAWRERCTVIDNASRDGTAEFLSSRFPDVDVLRLSRNVGFGAAVNAAAAESDAEALVVMNDDVFCPPETIELLVSVLDDDGVGMVSGVLVNSHSGLVDTAGIVCDPSLTSHDALHGRQPPRATQVSTLRPLGPSGGLAVYRRQAFMEVGGYDGGFFAYYEDVDLALRIRRAGWRGALVPEARAEHLGSATLGWRSRRKAELVGYSRGRIVAKYGLLLRRRALPFLLCEAMAAAVLCVELRSLAPITSRWRGFRDCVDREPYPDPGLIGRTSLAASLLGRARRRYGHRR